MYASGRFPLLDASFPVEVGRVTKRGEWYIVEGIANGRPVSVDLPAANVEGRPRDEVLAHFRRSLWSAAQSGIFAR